jgi:hypothetical protein
MSIGATVALVHIPGDRSIAERAVEALLGVVDIRRVEVRPGGRLDEVAGIGDRIVAALATREALEDPAFLDALDELRGGRLYVALAETSEVPLGTRAILVDARPPGRDRSAESFARHLCELIPRLSRGQAMPQIIDSDRLYSEATRRRRVRDRNSAWAAAMAMAISILSLPAMIHAGIANASMVTSDGALDDVFGIMIVVSALVLVPGASVLINEHAWGLGDRRKLFRTLSGRQYIVEASLRTAALAALATVIGSGIRSDVLSKPDMVEMAGKVGFAFDTTVYAAGFFVAACVSALASIIFYAPHRISAWMRRDRVMEVQI